MGNKKVGKFYLSDLARWQTSKSLPFAKTISIPVKAVKTQFPPLIVQGKTSSKSLQLLTVCFILSLVTQPLALVIYEKLLPGTQLVNRLQDLNYRVQTVTDAATLETCARQEKPMLVMADLESSRKNVPQAISRLKQDPSTQHIPIIAFAPDSDFELQEAGRNSGASLVVSESVIVHHLEQFLEQALQVE